MNTKQLEYILEIAQKGNLSAAAKSLRISQPALSKFLQAVENETGHPMFRKEQNSLRLTEAGKIYARTSRRIIEIQMNLRTTIASKAVSQKDNIRIAVSPLRGVQIIAKIFSDFSKKYPHIDIIPVETYSQDQRNLILKNEADLAISTSYNLSCNDFLFLPMHGEELLLCVPTFHRLVKSADGEVDKNRSIDIREFEDSPFILMGDKTTIGRACKEIFQEINFHPFVIFETNNFYMIQEMLQQGFGVGIVPHSFAKPSDKVVYFHLQHFHQYYAGILTAPWHCFSEAERYFIYLYMMQIEQEASYTIKRNGTLNSIYNEFCNENS